MFTTKFGNGGSATRSRYPPIRDAGVHPNAGSKNPSFDWREMFEKQSR